MEQATRTHAQASRPFDMDVKAIRAKARKDIESGAVTDTYRADRQTVLKLLNEALAFCDSQGFAAVQLWTFSGLNAARRLYESFGFTLHKEWQGDQWGRMMTEQQFSRQQARAE